MKPCAIALFGEAEKGEYHTGYFCTDLQQLADTFGNPPPGTRGLYLAVQTLLYHYQLIFFRVQEEGFSVPDYLHGAETLMDSPLVQQVAAIAVPGVGDKEVVQAFHPLLVAYHQILIADERDLWDYLTH